MDVTVADGVFALALTAPLLIGTMCGLSLIRMRSRTRSRVAWCSLAFLATLACHPIVQVWLLEPADEQRGLAMASDAITTELVGMSAVGARGLLGEPDYVHISGDTTCWGYKQLPGYWLGSHFQVFVRDQAVFAFDANDD